MAAWVVNNKAAVFNITMEFFSMLNGHNNILLAPNDQGWALYFLNQHTIRKLAGTGQVKHVLKITLAVAEMVVQLPDIFVHFRFIGETFFKPASDKNMGMPLSNTCPKLLKRNTSSFDATLTTS